MTIRAKISLVVLSAALAEALILGGIAFVSVSRLSGHAAELDRIGGRLERTQALSVQLHRLSDPAYIFQGDAPPREKFAAAVDAAEEQMATFQGPVCRSLGKFASFRERLATIRAQGNSILASWTPSSPVPHEEWRRDVHAPTEEVAAGTNELTASFLRRSREVEAAAQSTARTAGMLVVAGMLLCVVVSFALLLPIARGISRPIENLATQSEQIADGRAGVRAAESGPPEAVQLARSFNHMVDTLEGKIRDRLLELRRQDDQLRRTKRLAEAGLIANAVAHDLNNPLANIVLNAEALIEAPADPAESRQIASEIYRDASRCREIAHEIRHIGREGETSYLPTSIEEVAREAASILRFRFEARDLRVAMDFAGAPAKHSFSPTRILEVFVNLIDNAIDASPEGGEVAVRARAGDDGVEVEVEDQGAGISDEVQPSMWKPFFTTKSDGTGLGLAVSRRIVEQHGGKLLYMRRNGSTVFRFNLPPHGDPDS